MTLNNLDDEDMSTDVAPTYFHTDHFKSAFLSMEEFSPVVVRLKKKNGKEILLHISKLVVHSDAELLEIVVSEDNILSIN